MRKLLILIFATISLVNAWELKETIDSEGIETTLIQCNNGSIKAIYYGKEGKYEITPTIFFDSLEQAANYICKEK